MRKVVLVTFVVISFSTNLSAQFSVLHAFGVSSGVAYPQTTLTETSQGVFSGTYNNGLFQIDATGTFAAGASFVPSNYELAVSGPLLPASNGLLYGVRSDAYRVAGVFETNDTLNSVATVAGKLVNAGPLTEGLDGNLWTTEGSSTSGYKVIKISLSGTVTVVGPGPNNPTAGPLLQASDGNFYGATFSATAGGSGVIYKVSETGDYSLLYTFPSGESSVGGLIEASNGLLYGTALYYEAVCPDSVGEVFSISLNGLFTSLFRFGNCYPSGLSFGPLAGLVEASDGYLYGTTVGGGLESLGNIFKMSLNGEHVAQVYKFIGGDGASPGTYGPAMTQGSDGAFYGTTFSGGSGLGGIVFKLDLGLAPPLPSLTLFQPQSGAVGTAVRLKGNHLIGLSGVSFNGIPAQFTAVNVNYAYAVVPVGASTGPISVRTANGTYVGKTSFTVE